MPTTRNLGRGDSQAIRASDIIERVYEVVRDLSNAPEESTKDLSLKAAEIARFQQPFDHTETELHGLLIDRRADWFICIQAWALLADMRSHINLTANPDNQT